MEAFISNGSALEFWRLYRRSQEKRVLSLCYRKPPGKSPDTNALRSGKTWGLTLPIDVMVGTPNARRPSKTLRPHVCPSSLPDGAFLNAGGGLFVSSPEFCFFQMASECPLAKLIALGIELCGSYSLPDKDTAILDQETHESALYDLKPLTSKKKLKAFISHTNGWHGHKQASKAIQYITDGSASPMETILCIFLTLPYRYGGYGLPLPELNGRIYPEKEAKRFVGREFYRGDLLWRKAGVVAEYNSDLEHASPDRIARDAIRRSDLALCGIYEVTVTKRQVFYTELFEKVARQIASKIGRELRYNNKEFSKVHQALRSSLL